VAPQAIALAQQGANVAIVGRRLDDEAARHEMQFTATGRRCEVILADCGKAVDCTRCVRETESKLGPVEILVHSAGGPVNGGLFEPSHRKPGTAHLMCMFMPSFIFAVRPFHRCGRKKKVRSFSSRRPQDCAYHHECCLSGREGRRCRNLRARWLANLPMTIIRINCVAPGVVRTRFHETDERRATPLESGTSGFRCIREGTPEQVAEVILMFGEE